MGDAQDYSSIKPLNATAQKEAMSLLGLILLVMVVTLVGIVVVGLVIGSL